VAVLIAWGLISSHLSKRRREQRRAALLAKYNDPNLVDKIMGRTFWQGQTQEQLLDSLGQPVDIDQKVLKTKTKETWKYNRKGKSRFGLRITVENGVVVGWDQKD
jgi:hypothetical protein